MSAQRRRTSRNREEPVDVVSRDAEIPGDRSGPDALIRAQHDDRLKLAIPIFIMLVMMFGYYMFWYRPQHQLKEPEVQFTQKRLDANLPDDLKPPPPIPVVKDATTQVVQPIGVVVPNPDKAYAPSTSTQIDPPKPRNPNADRMSSSSVLANGGGGIISGDGGLGGGMKSTQLSGALAVVIRNPTYTISRGTPLGDCFSTVRINSEVPGQITCILAADVYGVNKKMVLLPRGTKIVGKQEGSLPLGQERLFALSARAETPDHVLINLDSPFTSELGEPGIDGHVDARFMKRLLPGLAFALLDSISVGISNKGGSGSGSGTTVVLGNSANATRDTAGKVLEEYKNIPPVLTREQGARLSIIAAQDLDLTNAYRLRIKE